MNCKSCNTRIPGGLRTCPNCGRVVATSSKKAAKGKDRQRLSASRAPEEAEIDLELEEELQEVAPDPGDSQSRSHPQPPPTSRRQPRSTSGSRSRSKSSAASREASSPGGFTVPDTAALRALVVDAPEMIEAGLSVFCVDGSPVGDCYETEVGDIDLLAQDEGGGLVIVMVAPPAEGKEIVAELLQRVGWVRKNLAKKAQEVRAIALLEDFPDEVGYAAAAVADTIQFKTYRLVVCFDDVSV